ncbi:MAG: FMN-binding negative transcriptional regulator [Ktedonobacteraceae bacterium]|nr:FMN-binding negative transcriptional regulator [Ktedonobacteraceae bacterium]
MYIPAHFREDNLEVLHRLMRDYSFATLVSMGDDGVPIATPLPFLLEAEPTPYGTLKAHMALGNPQWRTFQPDREVLVLFQGPHAYITPSWYEEALSVPTWNYATVHAYGIVRIIKDTALLYEHLKSLIQTHEAQFAHPWPFEDLPNDFVEKKMQGVVGFSIEITRLEGKFKMSQNRPQNDRTRVAAELRKSQDATLTSVGELVSGVHDHLRDDVTEVNTH